MQHAALRRPHEDIFWSLCLCVLSERAKEDLCLDVRSWSVSNVSLPQDGPSHDPAETCSSSSAAAVVHSMHCINGKESKESTFDFAAACSGSGLVPAPRAVRTPLKASLKTSALNIITVVTWGGRVCCRH